MNLTSLKPGQKAKITHVNTGRSSLRLMELGFVKETEITLTSVAPTGDPLAFQVGSSVVSLRRLDASLVQIELTA